MSSSASTRRVGGAAHERERLEQDQVGRVLLERAGEQADGLPAVGRVDVAVDAEGDRDLVGPAGLGRGLASQADGAPRDVHPVDRLAGLPHPAPGRPRSAVARPQVSVQITSQPTST